MERATKRRTILLAATGIVIGRSGARAQSSRRVARVGWLGWAGDTSVQASLAQRAFRERLAELGWRDGGNLVLEVRTGDREQGAALTGELVRAGVEVIAAQGPMVFAARAAAGTIPLVFAINGDPVQAGLVASLARPGGTLTGITALNDELSVKRVELIRAARPTMTRIAALANNRHPGVAVEIEATTRASRQLGLASKYFPLQQAQDLDAALAAIASEPFDALVAFPDTMVNQLARRLAEFKTRRRLPSISGWAEYAQAGNLMSYGPPYGAYFAHCADFVDKLLRGASAAELPVERPTRFELVLNRRVARDIGLTLPQALLARADEVVG